MTKEEQRFTAAVAAMQGMLSNPEIMRAKLDFFKYQTIDSCIKMSIQYADALMKEMDKHKPSDIDVINAAIKHVEDMGFKPNRFVNIVKIDKNNRLGRESFYYECYQCTQEGCDNDRISESHNYCHNCGSKIEWV